MKRIRKTIWTALCLSMMTGQSLAQTCDAQEKPDAWRIYDYFSHPQSPRTFRALSGMGDPVFGETKRYWEGSFDWRNAQNKQLLQLLMPWQDVSRKYFYPSFGECRIEGPMMTLKARIARLGADHPYVKQWLRAEQVVLNQCSDSALKPAPELPPAMTSGDAAILRLQSQDRAYQEAALLFYRDTQAALAKFQQIAQDKNSPMRPLAAYMVLAIHAGNKGSYRAAPAALSPQDALAEIHAALADPSLADIHAMASALIGFIGSTIADPATRHAQIAEALQALAMPSAKLQSDPVAQARYSNAVEDIPYLFGDRGDAKNEAWVFTGQVREGYTASAALAELAKTDPLAAWIGFPASPYRNSWTPEEPLAAAARRYLAAHAGRETTNPWIHLDPELPVAVRASLTDDAIARLRACSGDAQAAAALAFDFPELVRLEIMQGGQKGEEDVLRRFQEFPFKDHVYETVVSQTLGYLMAHNRLAAARKYRDTLKLDSAGASYNRNIDALILLAEDEDHLVKVMAPVSYYNRALLNSLSIAALWRLAARNELKRGERAMFARSAWTREYALGRTISAARNKLMHELNPEVTKGWRSQAEQQVSPDDRKVLADVLASPAMNIVMDSFSRRPDGDGSDERGKLTGIDYYNHNDNNWWCAWEPALRGEAWSQATGWMFGDKPDAGRPTTASSFVARSMDLQELAELSKVDCAPKLLGRRVIAWVQDPGWFGSRDGQAEALANVVLATRYGCNRQGSHLSYSRKAFQLLHAKFGDSAAAKRTRYWFQ